MGGFDRLENCYSDYYRRRPIYFRGESLRDDPIFMGGLDVFYFGSEGGVRRGAADFYFLKS